MGKMHEYIWLFFLLLFFSLPGCGNTDTESNPGKVSIVTEQGGDGTLADFVMTDNEKYLLSKAYSDPERIEDGKLWSHQEVALNQLRAGTKYLEEKYPSHTFDIISFSPANKFNTSAILKFQENTASDTYTVAVEPYEGGYTCTDNFYSALIGEGYDSMLTDILADNDIHVLSYTEFQKLLGAEINENISVEEFTEIAANVMRITHLFTKKTEDNAKVARKIERVISGEKIYGVYDINFIDPEDFGKTAKELNNEAGKRVFQDEWENISFSFFDIED